MPFQITGSHNAHAHQHNPNIRFQNPSLRTMTRAFLTIFQERKFKCYKYSQLETIYQMEEDEQHLVVAEKYILGKESNFFYRTKAFSK